MPCSARGCWRAATRTLLQTAEAIARHHHERWDGDGYPGGLAGDAIPLAGAARAPRRRLRRARPRAPVQGLLDGRGGGRRDRARSGDGLRSGGRRAFFDRSTLDAPGSERAADYGGREPSDSHIPPAPVGRAGHLPRPGFRRHQCVRQRPRPLRSRLPGPDGRVHQRVAGRHARGLRRHPARRLQRGRSSSTRSTAATRSPSTARPARRRHRRGHHPLHSPCP